MTIDEPTRPEPTTFQETPVSIPSTPEFPAPPAPSATDTSVLLRNAVAQAQEAGRKYINVASALLAQDR